MRNICAGKLRQRITLQKPVTTLNGAGRPVTAWEDAETVDAGRADVSGREFFLAQAYHAEDVVTWTIRWRDDIDTTWRIVHHDKTYEILEVNRLGDMLDYMRLRTRQITGQKKAAD